MKDVFIIGSKGIPAKYGGYETFVEYLTSRKQNKDIRYHVACLSNENSEFTYNDSRCFNVKVPNIGAAKAVLYDINAIKAIIKYIKKNEIKNATLLVLACRIGIVFHHYVKKLHKLGVRVIINPDGHEWKRSKWPYLIKKYWKFSEKKMVKYADRIICDSVNIEKYIHEEYGKFKPNTCFIAYGSDVVNLEGESEQYKEWLKAKNLTSGDYYLVVGRFVPENNYELMIKEFMKSNTSKKLVLITDHEGNKFYDKLLQETHFDKDDRIRFVGTVYDQNLLHQIRYYAYAYIHGHSVGGTNPSLLEGLGTTRLSLLFDVCFNHEVGQDAALYFGNDNNPLSILIDYADNLGENDLRDFAKKSKQRIKDAYSWELICTSYERELYE